MPGTIVGIYVASEAGAEMRSRLDAVLEADHGLVGDRYYLGTGTFSNKPVADPGAQLTLIEQEEIQKFNAENRLAIPVGDFRRNIVTRGIRLNDLVGVRFAIGDAIVEGTRLCEPCAYLRRLLGDRILPDMVGRAGLRTWIVNRATVRLGDRIGGIA